MTWKRVRNRKFGNNISIIYVKKDISVELFRDSTWGQTDNMNVIVRDKSMKSYESSFGKSIATHYGDSRRDAENWAKRYMETH